MYFTWLDSNSWLLELGGKRILLDPWLVGALTFGNLNWLFKGQRLNDRPIPNDIDLILLSQGLEDHAHPETLKKLDKSIPVVGSPGAAKVAESLGYTQVRSLQHGTTYSLNNQVEILALPGSPIGPTTLENGYILKDLAMGNTIYYEPHGYHSQTLKEFAPLDVVITPLIDVSLPLVGQIIRGQQTALDLAKLVNPQVMLPTAEPGDVVYEGLLVSILKASGNLEDFRSMLAKENLSARVLKPQSGERFEVLLEKRPVSVV